jgi:hypothetical protein
MRRSLEENEEGQKAILGYLYCALLRARAAQESLRYRIAQLSRKQQIGAARLRFPTPGLNFADAGTKLSGPNNAPLPGRPSLDAVRRPLAIGAGKALSGTRVLPGISPALMRAVARHQVPIGSYAAPGVAAVTRKALSQAATQKRLSLAA